MSSEENPQETKNEELKTNIELIANENMDIMNETYKNFNSIKYNNEELNKFKDTILSILKERDKIYLDKLIEYKIKSEKIKSDFDSMNKISISNFAKIVETQAKITSRLDQLNNYESFVSKTNDKLISHEVRLNNIREDFSIATQKYDKIYLDNLELPGFIGRCAKYKNCQVFFLEVIQDLAKLNKYREKSIIDLKMYKDKLETIISSMNTILDNNNASQIKYINETKDKILKDCGNMFNDVRENIKEIRVENSKYAVDLISQSMDMTKKWDKIEKIKADIFENFNYNINKYQMLTDDTIKSFDEFKVEYGVIRRKFLELSEFIKDVRFRKNIGDNVKKKEIKEMVKKLLRRRKSLDAKDIKLLNDISNIENIDYKKYYNIDNNQNEENNDDRSNSLKVSKNGKSETSRNNNRNNKKHKSISKEVLVNNMNQSAESTREHRISIKNPFASNITGKDRIDYSLNVSPLNIKNLKKDNNSAIFCNINNSNLSANNRKEIIHAKFKNELNVNEKRSNNFKNDANKGNKEQVETNKKINEKICSNQNLKEKNKEIKIDLKNNESKNSLNKLNKSKNIINDYQSIKLKEEKSNIKNKIIEKEMDFNEESQQEKKDTDNNNDTQNNEINIQDNTQENNTIIESNINNDNNDNNDNNNNNDNNDIKANKNEKKEKLEPIPKNIKNEKNDKNNKNDEVSQISLSRVMSFRSNIECKPSLIDDSSTISDGYVANSVRNYKNNNNIGLSSEKSLSFISDNNNVNRFLLNDIKLEHNDNDKIIKELASELEQSTAKKDKLASNKKDIESKFKNVCSSIEPINLSRKTGQNLSMDNKPKESDMVGNNNYKNQIYEYKDKNNNKNNNILNNALNNDNINKNINELNLTKTTQEEDHNNNITNINNSNLNELIPNKVIVDDNNNSHNINKSINDSNINISNLNPIKMNNEFYLNDNNSNNFNKKLHAVDQKLLNLELYTKEKILDLISQINLIKKNFKLPLKEPFPKEKINADLNPLNRTQFNDKYRTFNNSLLNNQNPNNYQNSFLLEKNKENIPNNIASNSQYVYNSNINLEKKRYSLREVNPKSILSTKAYKNGINIANKNTFLSNKKQSNIMTENNNSMRTTNEIIDEANTKIKHNMNNDINHKFLKEVEKKTDAVNILKNSINDEFYNKSSNKSLNYGQSRNSFAYSNSSFNGAEIKLVDLNKLANNHLPKRLYPISVNENDYFVPLNSK